MKKTVYISLVLLMFANVSISNALMNPKRWFECAFTPKKHKCTEKETKEARIALGIGVGVIAGAGIAAAGGAAAYQQHKKEGKYGGETEKYQGITQAELDSYQETVGGQRSEIAAMSRKEKISLLDQKQKKQDGLIADMHLKSEKIDVLRREVLSREQVRKYHQLINDNNRISDKVQKLSIEIKQLNELLK